MAAAIVGAHAADESTAEAAALVIRATIHARIHARRLKIHARLRIHAMTLAMTHARIAVMMMAAAALATAAAAVETVAAAAAAEMAAAARPFVVLLATLATSQTVGLEFWPTVLASSARIPTAHLTIATTQARKNATHATILVRMILAAVAVDAAARQRRSPYRCSAYRLVSLCN